MTVPGASRLLISTPRRAQRFVSGEVAAARIPELFGDLRRGLKPGDGPLADALAFEPRERGEDRRISCSIPRLVYVALRTPPMPERLLKWRLP